MPGQESARELADFVAVHSFYNSLLQSKLKHAIPLPASVANPESATTMRQWLALLDLAVQPVQLRDALKQNLPQETNHALIRYFLSKQQHTETDRDKADFIVTSLFRSFHPEFADLGESHDRYSHILKLAETLEAELVIILAEISIPPLKEEHRQLLHEFEFLHHEIEDFRTFDQLMDSGIVQRVRDIKQSFAESFYHPSVLAHVAVYNAIFGKKFDDLFRATTEQIKTFASKVQDEGASIMSKLDEGVTVKNLTEVEDEKVMTAEYGQAQEQFRAISKFKKAVDKRGGGRAAAAAAAPAFAASAESAGPVVSRTRTRPADAPARASELQPLSAPVRTGNNEVENGKVRAQLDAIRSYVRAAEKSSPIVPLTKGVVNINPAESEAFRVDYGLEKSFRADYALTMCTMVAMIARLVVEQHDLRAKQDSAYLWKPHADSIAYLIGQGPAIFGQGEQMISVADKRGLGDKVAAMKATCLRLRIAFQEATALLKTIGN
jgi:hypothetical protein